MRRRSPGPRRRLLRFELLEDRRVLSTVFVVNSLEDNTLEDGVITLREAIAAANCGCQVGDAPPGGEFNEIRFDPSLAGGTIRLARASTPFMVAANITIVGLGKDQLTIGTYTVREIVPTEYVQTAPLHPDEHRIDLRSGPIAAGYDFGNRPTPGAITGMKGVDVEFNGQFSPGDPGQAGVTIYLDLNNDGQLDWVDTNGNGVWDPGEGERWTVTDADGRYSIDDLEPGVYTVREIVPDGWRWMPPRTALDDDSSLVTHLPFRGSAVDVITGMVADNTGATLDQNRFGVNNNAYFFDGLHWMTLDHPDLPRDDAPRTLSAWVRSTSGQSTGTIDIMVSWGAPTTNGTFGLALHLNNEWYAYLGSTNFSSGVAADQNWHYLTLSTVREITVQCPLAPRGRGQGEGAESASVISRTVLRSYDGTAVTTYVNGERKTRANRSLMTAQGLLVMGTAPPHFSLNYTFHGALDDIRIYDRALGDSEIADLYAWERNRTVVDGGYVVRVDYGESVYHLDFGNVENTPPVVAELIVTPDPVVRPETITLTAEGVTDPDGEVVHVEFYRGEDLLGSDNDGSDGWSWSGDTAGWEVGEHTFYARALDNAGGWSPLVSATVTVENAPPAVSSLVATPDPVVRPGIITLQATGVSDPDGQVVRVEFYRGDVWLGADDDGSDGWSWSGETAGWSPGETVFSARAWDDDEAWSDMATTTATVENATPVVASLSVVPDPAVRPADITLTASGVSDPDGHVVRVEFYRGDDLLCTAEEGGDSWSWTGSTDGWEPGEHTFSARAQDNDEAWSQVASTTATIANAVPVVVSLSADADSVTRPGALTLTANGVEDPDGHVVRVEFYRGDQRLGESDGSGGWTWTVDTTGWALGETTFHARAQDDDGAWSEWASATVTVVNAVPLMESLTATPDPVTRPGALTLTAAGVFDPDGEVALVEFYHGDDLLGAADDGTDGWTWTVNTAGRALGEHTLTARAQDNDGAWSQMVSATIRVYAELEPVDFGGVPVLAVLERTLNVSNDGTGPLFVEGSGLGLPFAIRPANESGDGHDWIVAAGANKTYVVSYLPTEDGWHQATLTMVGDADGRVVQISGWGASGWQNPVNPFDVNGDGYVTPQDVLLLINEINRGGGEGPLAPRTAEQPGPPHFLDVLGNGHLTPNDVLQVINYINRGGDVEELPDDAGEGESDSDHVRSLDYDWWAMVDAVGSSASAGVPSSLPKMARLDDPAVDLADLDAYFAAMA